MHVYKSWINLSYFSLRISNVSRCDYDNFNKHKLIYHTVEASVS